MSMKELTSIDVTSFTVISTGVATLVALLLTIILDVVILLSIPNSAPILIFFSTTIVFGTMVCNIFLSFSEGYLYNLFSKKLKCISLDIDESGYIKKISPAGTALISAAITFSILVIVYFAFVLIIPSLLSTLASIFYYTGNQAMFTLFYTLIIMVSNPLTVLIGIIATTIIVLLLALIATYIYNLLANSDRGIIVNISKEEKYFAVDKIEYTNFAISIATIMLVINIISGIMSIIAGSPIFSTLVSILIGFVISLIEALIIAAFYNYLAPKIGKFRFELGE